ncbi:MAG: gliding motility-associated ABC transporter substrate-binding protein GldG [Flavobacteriaceae bacterium]|nr:gliding motility-associated ABC transporter substrate-binding protein GldG [Flavobacteriaceae bacterium]
MKNIKQELKNLLIPLLLIVIAQGINYRWDVTQDQRYTLNDNTKILLTELEQPLKIDIFLTGQLPAHYLRLHREIKTLISGMEGLTDQLVVSFVDPFEGSVSTQALIDEMTQFGLPPEYIIADQKQALEQTVVFPWAMINDGNKSLRIPLLEKVLGDDEQQKINRSIAQLEFHFYEAFFKINQKQKPTLAVLTSHGTSEAVKIADFMRSLQPYFQLASFDLKALENDPEKTLENLRRFPLLMISNPTEAFSETEKYLLDQYLMHGGKQWWTINPVAVNRDSLFNTGGSAVAVGRSLNMESAFFKYGFRLQKNLVKDMYCAPVVLANGSQREAQYLPYPWPYYSLAQPRQNELFGNQAGKVLIPFPSSIDTLNNSLDKTILIGSSDFSQSLQTPKTIALKKASEKLNPALFDQKSQILGLLLEGKFNSAFDNRITPVKLEDKRTTGQSQIMVFSSGAVAENQVDKGNPLELGYDKWTNNFYFNKVFLQQTVHHLMGNHKLLQLQNKGVELPHLDFQKVEQQSRLLKILMLLIPLAILLILGALVFRWRIRRFGQ